MDLQQLYDTLTTALAPFDKDQEFSHKIEIIGGTAIYRAPNVDLNRAIDALNQAADAQSANILRIEIYADTLTASGNIPVPYSCSFIALTARLAFVDAAKYVTFRLHAGKPFGVRLVKDDHKPNLTFSFSFDNGKGAAQALNLGPGILGNLILLDADGKITFKDNVSPLLNNFEYKTAAEQIMDNGELRKLGFNEANDNLPKLLNFQLLLASQNQATFPELNYEVALFVAKVTANIPKALDINSQASTILSNCVLDNKDVVGNYISPLNIELAKDVLLSRLAAASEFDSKYQDFARQGSTSKDIQSLASATLTSAKQASQTYQLLADTAQGNYESAQIALRLSQANFNDLQTMLPDVQKNFQEGIEAYKTKMIVMGIIDGLLSVVAIAGSIAVAVAVPPAGPEIATAAVADAAKAVEVAADATKKVATLADLINKLKKLFARVKPALEAIGKLVDAIKKIVMLMKTFKRVDNNNPTNDQGGLQMPVSVGDDAINMSADWDVFAAEMDSMYSSLQEDKIKGAREFFVLMQDMAIRAKALYAAQYAVTITGQAYCAALAQAALNQKQVETWQNAVDKLTESQENYKIFRLAMLDKLLQTRSWVLYDFRNYVSAYCFYALNPTEPITLDALKDMGDWRSDAATLQTKIAAAKTKNRSQDNRFLIKDSDTSGALTLSPDWKDTLKSSRMFTMNVMPTSAVFSKRARIRITNFSIFLNDVQVPANTGSIRLTVNFGRNLQDLSMDTPQQLLKFIGAETRAGFEYASPTDIRMQGKLLYPQDAVAIPPFTTWTVVLDDSTDCSTISGVTLDLKCEVTVLA